MNRKFDWFDRFELPQLILRNPSGKEICQVSHALNTGLKLRFNGYSEMTFDVFKYCDGLKLPYYDKLEPMREVVALPYGVFVIESVDETSDGATWSKNISCKSKESLFATKSLVSYKGTFRIYSPTSNDTILGKLLIMFPEWRINTVDSTLLEEYRTYDVSEQNWYDFLLNDVCEDFDCVFKFDTYNMTISVHSVKNAIKKTDIYVGFDNLLKSIDIKQSSDQIVTALEVYGGDGLSIHGVNPLGTGVIYNYSHYKNTSWLSQSTIDSLTRWENKVVSNQSQYGTLLSTQKTLSQQLITLKSELYDLESKVKGFNEVIGARISANQSYSDITPQLVVAEQNVTNKKTQIKNKETEIEATKSQIASINESLKFDKNFTKDELKEISSITKQGVYQNDCFIKTSIMSDVEVQEQSQKLYDLSLTVLNKLSQPRYTFSSEIVNFFMLKEFDVFSEQLELGCEFTINIGDGKIFSPILLEMDLDFNNPTSSSFTFCNDLRPSNGEFSFADLFEGMQSSISSVNYGKGMWEDYLTSGDKDSFNNFKNNALDLATKDIVSNNGQEFTISSYGIRGKKLVDGNLSKNELWITNNCIAMSSDNFNSSRLAIGEITYNGVKTYGIVADAIIGDLIAGKSMVIKNQNNTVTIDGNGINATNANLTLSRSDGSSKISINPSDGIKIQSRINNVLQDVFYVDGGGNLNFRGNLTGATGTFSGTINGASFVGGSININNNFKVDSAGNCTANSVSIRGGSFESGNITGGTITGTTVNGTYINGGSITGASITGGTISVDTDVRVGSLLYIGGNSASCGIQFGNGTKLEGNRDGIHIYGGMSCDRSIICLDNIYMGTYMNVVATQDWCESNMATRSYVNSEIDSLDRQMRNYVKNVVVNSSSKLIKVYFGDGSSESYSY